jgi:uncharacterized protein
MSKTAVITGATSGIGAAFARRLAKDGYDLIITGRRQEIINKLADDLTGQYHVKVNVIIAEFSEDADVQKVIDAFKSNPDVEILINNAGYFSGRMEYFMDTDMAEYEKMIKVLSVVPMKLVYAVIPSMSSRGKGTIINVASLAAIYPMRKQTIYSASKAFVKFFSEGLYMELGSKGIKVQALCPGMVATDFYRNRLQKNTKGPKIISPEEVVDSSLKYLEKNRAICIPGGSYKVMNALFSLLPRSTYYKYMAKMVP